MAESISPATKATVANVVMANSVASVVARSVVAKSVCKKTSAFVICNVATLPISPYPSPIVLKYAIVTKS